MTNKLLIDRTPLGVVTLTFNRPEARNALDWETQHAFADAIAALVHDPTVRVVIVTGAGDRAFCAGGDLVELASYADETDGAKLAAVMGKALDLLEEAPFPSIAAINGHALGGGSEIAIACDLRVMNSAAQLGFVQLSLALTPGWGAGQRLLRVVGYPRALELLLMAQPISAAELLRLGVVNRVEAAPLEAAQTIAQHIAGWDREAVAAMKRVLRYGLLLSPHEARAAERDEFPRLWASEAHLGAVENFLSRKR